MNFDSLSRDAVLAAIGDAPLRELQLSPEGTHAQLARAFSTDAAGATITCAAAGTAQIELFRHPPRSDQDGLLAANHDHDDAGLPPPLTLRPGEAALKYRFAAVLSGSAGRTLADAGFQVDGDGEIAFGLYRRHPEATLLSAALATDLAGFRHPFSAAEILALSPGDAVFCRATGRLSAQFSSSASDLLAGHFTLLQQALQGAGVLRGAFRAGVAIELSASVADTFLVCFSRDEQPGVLVSLRKADRCHSHGGLCASCEINYAPTGAFERLAQEAFQSLLGAEWQLVERLRGRADYDALAPEEKALVDAVLARLPDPPAAADRLAAFQQLATRLETALRRDLRGRLTAAWSYDYDRVTTAETLLVARLSPAALTQFHADLLRLRSETLLTAARRPDAAQQGIVLQRLLQEDSTETTRTWGFTLGLARLRFGGRDARRFQTVTRRNAAGEQRMLYSVTRRHTFATSWEVEGFALAGFDAAMRAYRATPAPADFDFSLKIGWELGNFDGQPRRVARALDEAAVLGAIADEPRLARARALAEGLELGRWTGAAVATGLTLDAPATARFLDLAAARHEALKYSAFAAALRWLEFGGDEVPGRDTTAKRLQIYAPILRALSTGAITVAQVPEAIRRVEAWNRYGDLAQLEADGARTSPLFLRGVLALLGGDDAPGAYHAGWDAAMQALGKLAAACREPAARHEVVPATIEALHGVWQSPLLVRALGWFAATLADNDPIMQAGLTRTAVLKGSVDGKRVVYPLAAAASR